MSEYTTIRMPTMGVPDENGNEVIRAKYLPDLPQEQWSCHYKVLWYGVQLEFPPEAYCSLGELPFFKKLGKIVLGRKYLKEDWPANKMVVDVCMKDPPQPVVCSLLRFDDCTESETLEMYKKLLP